MRHRRRSSVEISLFPFLSILACVIGTLTLVIAGMTTGAISTIDAVLVEEYVLLQDETESAQQEAEGLRPLIAQAEALADELRRAEEQLEELKAVQHTREREREYAEAAAEAELVSLLAQESRIEEEAASLEQSLRDLELRTAEVSAELERLGKVADSAEDTVVLSGGGSGEGLRPTFVECTEQGLVLWPDKPEAERERVATDQIERSARFIRLLRSVKKDGSATVIFLVRPGGVPAFDVANALAYDNEARAGSMAVPGLKRLDFSLFEEAED